MRQWLDTHLHLLYPERLHYDWTAEFSALDRPFHWHDYWLEAQALGIGPALHMEADVRATDIDDETALVAELSTTTSGQLVGAISACRPESRDTIAFSAFVERSTADPSIHGFRRVLHTQPDGLSATPQFRANLRMLTAQGHPFELCVLPRQSGDAVDLAKSLPETTFVLDHCGNPRVANNQFAEWRSHVRSLAALPNVHCKLSGLIGYADPLHWQDDHALIARDLRPYVEEIAESFGWQRIVWGSDFPMCTLTRGLTAWKLATDEMLRGVGNAELDALAHGNARRIYRLQPGVRHD